MSNKLKKIIALGFTITMGLTLLTGCGETTAPQPQAMSDDAVFHIVKNTILDGKASDSIDTENTKYETSYYETLLNDAIEEADYRNTNFVIDVYDKQFNIDYFSSDSTDSNTKNILVKMKLLGELAAKAPADVEYTRNFVNGYYYDGGSYVRTVEKNTAERNGLENGLVLYKIFYVNKSFVFVFLNYSDDLDSALTYLDVMGPFLSTSDSLLESAYDKTDEEYTSVFGELDLSIVS